ncbi:MAG: methyl viologen-reducing hydrogenase [Desulfobacula sp.]|nr:methyl viologen-reducing hydrogenase [Desulfobacula sp.]
MENDSLLKIAGECLNACSGCEIALLNIGETLLDLLPKLDFVHFPILMDHKYYGQLGEKSAIDIPHAAAGIVSGGIRNEDHLAIATEMRKKCDVLISLGTCATHGGIPAMANAFTTEDLLDQYYTTKSTKPGATIPFNGVPKLLDRCYALDEHIKVDIYLPGCPPHPDQIGGAIFALLRGDKLKLPFRSVCDTCPTIRKGKGNIKQIKRFITTPQFDPQKPIDEMECLLEQGYLCSGPVTKAGCSDGCSGGYSSSYSDEYAKNNGGIPRCLGARVPCRGCYGPVKQDGNQLLDMLNALASNGIDINTLPDRDSLLRFSGAHNRLICKKESNK